MRSTKKILSLLWLPALFFVLQCNSVDIFKTEETDTLHTPANHQSLAPLLQVQITGNGVNQQLAVYPNGLAIITGHPDYAEKRTLFPADRVEEIRDLFIYNDILNVNNHLANQVAADALTYDITAAIGATPHIILSTGAILPPGAAGLIAGIDAIIEETIHDGLVIEFFANNNLTTSSAALEFTLQVTNTGRQAIDLVFPSSQRYDFYIRRMETNALAAAEWSWAGNKAFSLAIETRTINPKETLTYTAVWGASERAVTKITGTLLIGGQLTSTPGGTAKEIPLLIP